MDLALLAMCVWQALAVTADFRAVMRFDSQGREAAAAWESCNSIFLHQAVHPAVVRKQTFENKLHLSEKSACCCACLLCLPGVRA